MSAYRYSVLFPLLFLALPSLGDPLPRAEPETVGMSSARLALITSAFRSEVEAGRMPGAVIAIARKGRLAYFEAIGYRDKAANAPMTTDAIFYLASMTKPMVSVGSMMLYEEGRLLMTAPISKYLAPLGKNPVAVIHTGADGKTQIDAVPARREISVQDLLRHTSGIPYGGRGNTPVHKMYPAGSSIAATTMTSEEFLEKLGSLPLLHQPGTVWDYSLSTDVLGLLLEATTGQRLGQFLQERLWQPLGMVDTGFGIPPAKRNRVAQPMANDPNTGKPRSILFAKRPAKFDCGGACAVSTAGDYIRFAQMLLNKGRLGDARILGRKTVEYMTTNHLGPDIDNRIPRGFRLLDGYGFGLGVAVRGQTGVAGINGSVGDYSWTGAFGTFFWVDPKEQLAVVFMAQTFQPVNQHNRQLLTALVYQAIAD